MRRWAEALALAAAVSLAGCQQTARLVEIAPALVAPGSQPSKFGPLVSAPAQPPSIDLPPEQATPAFEFAPTGAEDQGRRLYRVRIGRGGSPAAVALSKLTPLFQVDGKDGPTYVSEAYFRQYPGRTPSTVQPGDEFLLPLPADTFVVRWQEERQESFGHPGRVREYVSERGDRLRYYLSDPFPVRYDLESADRPGRSEVHFHPDLAYLLTTQRTDPVRLAQLVYRVPDPDLFQVETMRRLTASVRPGVAAVLEVDRTVPYLDPVRAIWSRAAEVEPVEEPGLGHLRRAMFSPASGAPFAAVEDAVGTTPEPGALADGQVFRIVYEWDGTVHVFYKTGRDDSFGRRDPYQHRDNGRWAAIFARVLGDENGPVKWGPGEPSDLEPFPTARDPAQRDPQRYDYLLPGRVIVLTFKPVRFEADAQAQREFVRVLAEVRATYREQMAWLKELFDYAQARGLLPSAERGRLAGGSQS